VGLMSLRQKYLRILSGIVPAGAAGLSLLLGSTAPNAAEHRASSQPSTAERAGVAERLAAIREALSEVAAAENGAAKPDHDNLRLAWGNWWHNWGWRPWGWGWPNWNNWRNWNNWPNFWRNW
jgi:hypothetical protein